MDVSSDSLDHLRARTSVKWRAYPPDVLPLFIAEMDFPLAEPIAARLRDAIDVGDTGYAYKPGELADAFAGFAEQRWGWEVDPSRISTTTDVSSVIVESLRQSITPGDPVVINSPVYPPFYDLVSEAGGSVVDVPLIDEGGTRLDLDGIDAAFAAGARAMVLCNPHNPLGLVHPADQLRELATVAAQHDATIVSDEIHAPLTQPDASFVPFLSVSDDAREHGIAAHSASKAWNLAGLKCAMFVTASRRMTSRLKDLPDEVHYRTSLFGMLANTAAYENGTAWLDGVLAALRTNRELLDELLDEHLPEVTASHPHASYLSWLDMRGLDWGDNPSARALKTARVALNSGLAFGPSGAGFVRLNFACSPDMLREAVARLAAAR